MAYMKTISPDSIFANDHRLHGMNIDVFKEIEILNETILQTMLREANNEELLERIEGDLKRAKFDAEFGLSARIKAEANEEIRLLHRVRRNTLSEQKKLDEWITTMFEYRDLLYGAVPLN